MLARILFLSPPCSVCKSTKDTTLYSFSTRVHVCQSADCLNNILYTTYITFADAAATTRSPALLARIPPLQLGTCRYFRRSDLETIEIVQDDQKLQDALMSITDVLNSMNSGLEASLGEYRLVKRRYETENRKRLSNVCDMLSISVATAMSVDIVARTVSAFSRGLSCIPEHVLSSLEPILKDAKILVKFPTPCWVENCNTSRAFKTAGAVVGHIHKVHKNYNYNDTSITQRLIVDEYGRNMCPHCTRSAKFLNGEAMLGHMDVYHPDVAKV